MRMVPFSVTFNDPLPIALVTLPCDRVISRSWYFERQIIRKWCKIEL